MALYSMRSKMDVIRKIQELGGVLARSQVSAWAAVPLTLHVRGRGVARGLFCLQIGCHIVYAYSFTSRYAYTRVHVQPLCQRSPGRGEGGGNSISRGGGGGVRC